MREAERQPARRLRLFDTTSIGVGAIVGGGILALAGTAFAASGAGAWLAFLLNGIIAIVTSLSFAELSTAFPQSGGTYLFAKRALSVGAAFSVWPSRARRGRSSVAVPTTSASCRMVSCWGLRPRQSCSWGAVIASLAPFPDRDGLQDAYQSPWIRELSSDHSQLWR